MIYDKKALKAKVEEIKTAHEKAIAAQRVASKKSYEIAQKKWVENHKDKMVASLTDALKKAKAGTLTDTYYLNNLRGAPQPPKDEGEVSCVPIIMSLNALSEILDTVADDTISASSLARAGVGDLAKLLRRPC